MAFFSYLSAVTSNELKIKRTENLCVLCPLFTYYFFLFLFAEGQLLVFVIRRSVRIAATKKVARLRIKES